MDKAVLCISMKITMDDIVQDVMTHTALGKPLSGVWLLATLAWQGITQLT